MPAADLKNRFQTGFVDLLSLAALGFLVVSLLAITSVITKSKTNFSPLSQASQKINEIGMVLGASACGSNGSTQCNGSVQQVCSGGTWQNSQNCAYGCSGGSCKAAPVCSSGQLRCDGNESQVCSGGRWNNNTYCSNGCSGGTCKSGTTTTTNTPAPSNNNNASSACSIVGKLRCSGNISQVCNGTKWNNNQDCSVSSSTCNSTTGQCDSAPTTDTGTNSTANSGTNANNQTSAPDCPGVGQMECADGNVKVCNGTSWVTNQVCNNGCYNNACVPDNNPTTPPATTGSGGTGGNSGGGTNTGGTTTGYTEIISCSTSGGNWNGSRCVYPTPVPKAVCNVSLVGEGCGKGGCSANTYCQVYQTSDCKTTTKTVSSISCNTNEVTSILGCSNGQITSYNPTTGKYVCQTSTVSGECTLGSKPICGDSSTLKTCSASKNYISQYCQYGCANGACNSQPAPATQNNPNEFDLFSNTSGVGTYGLGGGNGAVAAPNCKPGDTTCFQNYQNAVAGGLATGGIISGNVVSGGLSLSNLANAASGILSLANGSVTAIPTATYVYGTSAITSAVASLPANAQSALSLGSFALTATGTFATGVQCAYGGDPNSPACTAQIGSYLVNPTALEDALKSTQIPETLSPSPSTNTTAVESNLLSQDSAAILNDPAFQRIKAQGLATRQAIQTGTSILNAQDSATAILRDDYLASVSDETTAIQRSYGQAVRAARASGGELPQLAYNKLTQVVQSLPNESTSLTAESVAVAAQRYNYPGSISNVQDFIQANGGTATRREILNFAANTELGIVTPTVPVQIPAVVNPIPVPAAPAPLVPSPSIFQVLNSYFGGGQVLVPITNPVIVGQ